MAHFDNNTVVLVCIGNPSGDPTDEALYDGPLSEIANYLIPDDYSGSYVVSTPFGDLTGDISVHITTDGRVDVEDL